MLGLAPREGWDVILTGVVRPTDVDWEYGFTSFMIYGEDQWEVSLLSHSPVLVTHLDGRKLHPPVEGTTGTARESWRESCP